MAINKVLFASGLKIKSIKNGHIIEIPDSTPTEFINYGIDKANLASVDLAQKFTGKDYVIRNSTPTVSGLVFSQPLDVTKPIHKIVMQ